MSTDGMDRKGKVAWTSEYAATHVVVHDQADYPKLLDKGFSQRELRRARSAADIAMPWLVWPAFAISNIVGASSSPVILTMKRAAPISLAGWRHQVSTLAMLPFFIFEWRKVPKSDRAKFCNVQSLGLYFLSSLFLSCHFACYLWSLGHTSMIHALFLCCMSPVFVAIYTKLSGGVLKAGEVIGVSLGLIGVVILAAGTKVEKDNQSTYLGDSVAVIAAVSMAGYLTVGKKLRSWMPLFVFQFPVVALAAIILGTIGLLLEGWNNSEVGDISGVFGWVRKGTIYLGIGPGIVGHAGYSFVLRYASPLVMPTGFSLQPLIGATIGWAVGLSPTPGITTFLGGAVTLAGTLFVSCASEKHTELAQNREEDYREPATDDEEGQQGTKPLLQPSDRS